MEWLHVQLPHKHTIFQIANMTCCTLQQQGQVALVSCTRHVAFVSVVVICHSVMVIGKDLSDYSQHGAEQHQHVVL